MPLSVDQIPSSPSPAAPGFKPAQQVSAASRSNFDALSSLSPPNRPSQSTTPVPSTMQQQPSSATPPPSSDPFAALVSASPRGPSPFKPNTPQAQRQVAASSTLLDLAGSGSSQPSSGTAICRVAQPTGDDDEWNFASSLPDGNALPSTNQVQVLNTSLRVDFTARRVANSPRQIHIVASFSNATTQPLSELHFQVAIEKVRVYQSFCKMQWVFFCLCAATILT